MQFVSRIFLTHHWWDFITFYCQGTLFFHSFCYRFNNMSPSEIAFRENRKNLIFFINIFHKLELVNNISLWENIVVEYWNFFKVYQHFLIFLSDLIFYMHLTFLSTNGFFRNLNNNLKTLSLSNKNIFKTFW